MLGRNMFAIVQDYSMYIPDVYVGNFLIPLSCDLSQKLIILCFLNFRRRYLSNIKK